MYISVYLRGVDYETIRISIGNKQKCIKIKKVNGKKLLDQELERYREKAMRYKEKFLETSYLKDGSRIANFTTINKDRLREALISYQTDEKKYFVAQLMKSYQKQRLVILTLHYTMTKKKTISLENNYQGKVMKNMQKISCCKNK